MDVYIISLVLGILVFVFVSAVLGLVAFIRQCLHRRRERENDERLKRLEECVQRLEAPPAEETGDKRDNGDIGEIAKRTVPPPLEKVGKTVPAAGRPRRGEPEQPATGKGRRQGARTVWDRVEKSVGEKWIAWIGALVLIFAVGFFVEYAIDFGLLGPTARCALGVVVGMVMATVGDVCLRRNMRGLGQGLVGGGVGALYLSIFAAFYYYEIMPPAAAFGFMALITAGGMALAVLHAALPIAFISLLGGLLAPVLCSTGADNRDALFLYLLVLNLGALGVSFACRWRALDLLAMAGTWALFGGWYAQFYNPEMLAATTAWLFAFFGLFLILPFGYHLRTGRQVTVERFVMGLANAAVLFGFAYRMLRPDYDSALGFVAVALAAVYCVLGKEVSRRTGGAKELFGFVGLSMIFLTLAVPLHLGLEGTVIVWVVEAVVLLYLGYRFDYLPVRVGAFLVLLVAGARFFGAQWPLHTLEFVLFWNTSFGTALFVPLGCALFAWLHVRLCNRQNRWDEAPKNISGVAACLIGLVLLQAEAGLWMKYAEGLADNGSGEFYALVSRSLIWTVGSMLMLAGGLRWRSRSVRWASLPALAAGVVHAWGLYGQAIDSYWLFLNVRFLTAAVSAGAVFFWARQLHRSENNREATTGAVMYWIGAALLFLLLNVETWHFAHSLAIPRTTQRWVGLMALSVTWGVYAAALLAIGFRRRLRGHRFVGLGLFALTGLKLVLVDMAGVGEIFRVVSFFAIGLLMLGVSYLYQKAEQKMMRTEDGT